MSLWKIVTPSFRDFLFFVSDFLSYRGSQENDNETAIKVAFLKYKDDNTIAYNSAYVMEETLVVDYIYKNKIDNKLNEIYRVNKPRN